MKREQLRLGAHRVVDIYASTGGAGSYGSGYAVGDDLVLTAAHVVPEARGYLVRTLDYEEFSAQIVWADRRDLVDAALLRVAGAPWRGAPDRDSLRWGRLAGNEVKCQALGFPRAQQDAERRRDLDTMLGVVNLTSGHRSHIYEVDITMPTLPSAAEGRSWWQGMSGAALFGPGRELLGLLVAEAIVYGGSRLEAVPAARLLRIEEFSRLVGAGSDDAEEVSDRGVVADLDGQTFLRPPYKDLPAGASEAQLLLAEHRVVPFLGRKAELRSLRDWSTRPDRFGVAVVTGDQGAGKTRLGAELCEELTSLGWSAGFMSAKALSRALQDRTHVELVWPTLLVLDEPDLLTDQVIALIDGLSRRKRGARLRLLMLNRTPAGGDDTAPLPDQVTWWRRLNRETQGLAARTTSVTIRLGAGLLTVAEQRRHVAEALAKFGHGENPPRPHELTDPSPLRLHLAVLNAVRGDDHRPEDSPERLLLSRETTRWMRLLEAHDLADLGDRRAHEALALVTMTAPDQAEAVELLTAVPALDAGDASLERRFRISEWLAESYPGGPKLGLPSHSLVIEQLLEDTPDLSRLAIAIHDHPARTTGHLVTLLDTLRAAGRRARARDALHGLLAGRLAALVDAVAAEPGSELATMVDAALQSVKDPQVSGALATAAAKISHPQPSARFTIDQLRCRIIELAVDWHSHQRAATLALADAQTDLAAYRAALGHMPGARAAAEAALGLYRRLPSVPAASLARASGNLGVCLALAGELEKAASLLEDAAARYQGLAAQDPAHGLAHVDTLTSLAACQADQGHQALAIGTLLLAVTASGRGGILGGLIEPLGNLAKGLAGDPQAEHATTPDTRCYRPPAGVGPRRSRDDKTQSSTLIRLAARLTVGIADQTPTAIRYGLFPALLPVMAQQQARFAAWDHAEFLRVLSQTMAQQDEFEYAIAAATESIALYRRVAAKEKDRHDRLRLPQGLNRLARYCFRAGRLDEAVAHASESVDEYRLCFVGDPDLAALPLADALDDLAEYLGEADRLPGAVESQQEAVALYGELAAQDDRYRPELGDAGIFLGVLLMQASRADEAAAVLQQAADLFESLTAARPEYAPELATAHGLLASLAPWREDSAHALASAERAVELERVRALAGKGQRSDYPSALCLLSAALAAAGRLAEAFDQAEKAVSLIRDPDTEPDDELNTVLGWALSLMSEAASNLGRVEQALATADEAVSVLTQVNDTGAGFQSVFGTALSMQAAALAQAGRPGEAIAPALHALELYARPGTRPWSAHIAVLAAGTHLHLAMARVQLGLAEEALTSARTAHAELQRLQAGHLPMTRRLLAESCYAEGLSLVVLDRPADALPPLARAEELLLSFGSGDPYAVVRLAGTLAMTGNCHLTLGRAGLAVDHAGRALALLEEIGEVQPDRATLIQALQVHGASLSELGDAAAGYRDFKQIVDLYRDDPPRDPGSRSGLGGALTAVGLYLSEAGDPAGATPLLTEAAAIFRDLELEPGLYGALSMVQPHAQALAGLAGCRAASRDLAGAAESASEGVELLRAHRFRGQPVLIIQYGKLAKFLAQCLMELDQHPDEMISEAIEMTSEAIEAFRSLTVPGAVIELVQALNLRSVYQISLGDAASAAESAAEAVHLCRGLHDESGTRLLLASTLDLLGACLLGLGHHAESLARLQESADIFHDLRDTSTYLPLEHLSTEVRLGMCVTSLGRPLEAAGHFHAALGLLRQIATADAVQQPALAQTIMQLCEYLIDSGQAQDAVRNAPVITRFLELSAAMLGRLGYGDAAEYVTDAARAWPRTRP